MFLSWTGEVVGRIDQMLANKVYFITSGLKIQDWYLEKKRKNKSILECNVSCGIYLASHKYVLLLNDFIMTSSHQWWRLERRFLTQLWHASPVSNCRPLFASRNSDCSTVCELQAAANGYCEQLRLLAGFLIVSRHGKALSWSPLFFSSLSLVCPAF